MRHAFYAIVAVLVAGCADAGVPTPSNKLSVVGSGGATPSAVGSAGQHGDVSAAGSTGSAGTPATTNVNNRPPTAGMEPVRNDNSNSGTGGMTGGAAGVNGGAAGMSPPTAGAMGVAGREPTPPAGSGAPVVPAVSGDCPSFRSGTITFMGLGGIVLQAGTKAAGPTAPMVFYWHGTGGTSGEYGLQASAVHRGAIGEGGVLVSFQGTTGGDLLSGTFIFGETDFALTDQLFACAVRDHNVDPRQVFATGCSAGGLFSAAMATMRSNYLAAAAPNSGGWTVPLRFQNDWTPALMTIHGAPGVDVVIVDFSVTSQTADDGFKTRGGFVINCNHGGFHCGGGSLAPDIWKFFKAHPYGTKPSPWASALPAGFNSSCKIF